MYTAWQILEVFKTAHMILGGEKITEVTIDGTPNDCEAIVTMNDGSRWEIKATQIVEDDEA